MQLRAINPPAGNIPGISQAIAVESGRLMFLSGHVPIAADGSIPAGLEAQLTRIFENLLATLASANTDFRSVARLTIYIRDYQPSMLETVRRIRDRYVSHERPPASALIGVAALFHPDVVAEIDAVAVLPEAWRGGK